MPEMRYEPVSGVPKAAGCQTGTRALGLAIKDVFPELDAMTAVYGCFNPRRVAGSATWSLHAEGRAIDVGVGSRRNQLGWELACELVGHRTSYGTMRVIWDHHIWSTELPAEWRKLRSGTNQHTDHIHVEQFWYAARWPRSVQPTLERALRQSRK